ncbi:hypothetical protein [uncultured Acetatifactor sp.]|jgi:hypothetical protein|uniref:hypothetical protein n=1 Tax=uncultured Acetatifactor sp. TaxID=1671927 RepID=UPI0026183627|nr:hypothetical protein [uncultured Acetatifactor sp.]
MGNRAVYCLKEDGKENHFYAHYGANSLSPLLRLWQAMEIQKQLPENQSLAHIFEHLDYGGGYQEEHLADGDMFFAQIEPGEVGAYKDIYAKGSQLEMWVTLDVDGNQCVLEYNPNCSWYRTMGSYSIDLDKGLENVRRLLEYGEEQGITDFNRLLAIYHNSTGLAEKLEDARGSMRLSEYMDSPQTEEQYRRYREMLEREEPEGGQEEMER